MDVVEYFWRWAGFWAGFITGIIAHDMYGGLEHEWLRAVLVSGLLVILAVSSIPLARARRR